MNASFRRMYPLGLLGAACAEPDRVQGGGLGVTLTGDDPASTTTIPGADVATLQTFVDGERPDHAASFRFVPAGPPLFDDLSNTPFVHVDAGPASFAAARALALPCADAVTSLRGTWMGSSANLRVVAEDAEYELDLYDDRRPPPDGDFEGQLDDPEAPGPCGGAFPLRIHATWSFDPDVSVPCHDCAEPPWSFAFPYEV